METVYIRKIDSTLKFAVLTVISFFSFALTAQVTPAVQDTIKPGYNVGNLQLGNPPSVIDAYSYDPVTNRYIYTNKVDDFNINYPIILTPKEYDELVLRESMRKYFKKKSDAIDGKKEGAAEGKKDLLPL